MDLIAPVLLQLAVTSPLLLVWLVGIVLAALRLHDPRFRLVLAALILFLILGVAGTVVNLVVPISLQRRFMPASEIGVILGGIGLVRVLLETVAWGLLLVALFRRTPQGRLAGEGKA